MIFARTTKLGHLRDYKLKKNSWTAELETGISALDLDNQLLLGLINRVVAASEGANQDGLKSSLIDLQAETIAHFEREERLMAECQYEAAAQHQTDHRQLLAEIQHQINDLDAGKANVSYIGRFMHNWLLEHIVSKDSLFGKAVLTHVGITDRRQRTAEGQVPDEEIDIFEERRLGNLESILWNPKLAVGNELIDAGHRALCARLSAILAARKSIGHERLAILLEQLGRETEAHFEMEEQLMASCSYEHAVTHVDEHQKILNEFAHLIDDWRDQHISTELLCRFLYRWLLRHIGGSDIPLCEAMLRKGAEKSSAARVNS